MACNLSQYCAGNIAEAKKFYRDICRGNIFTGTIAAAKLFGSVNTGVTGHGLPQDRSSGGGSVLRINPPPGVSVLGQKLLPQDQSSPILRCR